MDERIPAKDEGVSSSLTGVAMPDDAYIVHGKVSHSAKDKNKCDSCKRLDKWFEEEVERAGGIEKLIESMSE